MSHLYRKRSLFKQNYAVNEIILSVIVNKYILNAQSLANVQNLLENFLVNMEST